VQFALHTNSLVAQNIAGRGLIIAITTRGINRTKVGEGKCHLHSGVHQLSLLSEGQIRMCQWHTDSLAAHSGAHIHPRTQSGNDYPNRNGIYFFKLSRPLENRHTEYINVTIQYICSLILRRPCSQKKISL